MTLMGLVCCGDCLSELHPEVGRQIETPGVWLWWRCPNGHITDSVPVPSSWVGSLNGVMHDGTPGLQPPGVAEPPEEPLRR